MNSIQKIIELINQKKFIEAENIIKYQSNKSNQIFFLDGVIKANQSKFKEAIKLFELFLNQDKNHFDANLNLAGCYHEIGEFEKAINYYEKCIDINPHKSEAFKRLAMCHRFNRDYEKAINVLEKSLQYEENKDIILLLGNVFREKGSFENAQLYFKKLVDNYPNNFDGKLAIANLEIDKGQLKSAKDQLKNLLSIDEFSIESKFQIRMSLAKILIAEGKYHQAIEEYSKLMKIKKNPNISYNLALCHLFQKNYEVGWSYHEDRINLNSFGLLRKRFFNFSKPKWEPNRPKKNLLIWAEQGIGDVILHSQFLEIIKNDFKNLSLAVDEKLMIFFQKIYPDLNVINIEKISDFSDYEYHLPIGSMGKNFQKNFNNSILKNKKDYPFEKKDIPNKIKKLRCGISWKSTNKLFGHKKSILLEQFKNIFMNNEIEFINLQYSYDNLEIERLEYKLNKKIFLQHNIDCFEDIDGVASLIQSCDFVITVSNSNAHISGKLGVKTFLLLPLYDGKLWYWGANEDKEIPWYPSIIPLRNNKEGNWGDSISSLINEIEKL